MGGTTRKGKITDKKKVVKGALLKNKIIKVIIMVLIVSFFERILKISQSYNEPIEMLYFAISVFALSLGVYFMKKHN